MWGVPKLLGRPELFSGSARGGIGETAEEVGVQSIFAGAENEDEESGKENGVRGGSGELIGVREDGQKGFAIADDVRHGHVDGENQSDEAREQADGKKNAAEELDGRDKRGGRAWCGKPERGEKFGDVGEIVELAPAVLRELRAPINADEQQEGRLESAGDADSPGVEFANLKHNGTHLFNNSLNSI